MILFWVLRLVGCCVGGDGSFRLAVLVLVGLFGLCGGCFMLVWLIVLDIRSS